MVVKLKELANVAGPGKKLPTLRNLVRDLGVSQTTVVRAIEIVEREGVLVRRHGSGIYVAADIRPTQLLFLCDMAMMIDLSPFWGTLLQELLEKLSAAGTCFELRFTTPDLFSPELSSLEVQLGQGLNEKIKKGEYVAALVIGVRDQVVDFLDRSGITCVSFAAPGHFIVNVTPSEVMNQGLSALCDRGCRCVSVHGVDFASDLDHAATFLRSRGVTFAPSSQIRPPRRPQMPYSFRPDRIEEGFEGAMRTFGKDRSEWPDGILSVIEQYTLGFLHGMMKLGVRPGTDVLIATHSNLGTSTLLGFEEQVIRIAYDIDQLSDALSHAATSIGQGIAPVSKGWEYSIDVQAADRDSTVLFIKPEYIVPSSL